MTTTFETAKVGDRVWCIRHGWGEIRELDSSKDYPIHVRFQGDGGFTTYTTCGLYTVDDVTRTLFWDEVVIDAPVKPVPQLEVDAKVVVWNDGRDRFSRHFSYFSKDGVLHTFSHGKTSFTGAGHTTPWDNWELAE